MSDDDAPIIGTRAIARELNYTPQQVRNLNDTGRLPTTRLGSRITTTRRLLREWRAGLEERARSEMAKRRAGV